VRANDAEEMISARLRAIFHRSEIIARNVRHRHVMRARMTSEVTQCRGVAASECDQGHLAASTDQPSLHDRLSACCVSSQRLMLSRDGATMQARSRRPINSHLRQAAMPGSRARRTTSMRQ
jgi:hypothetical protein